MPAEQALDRGVALRMKKVLSIAGVCCDMVFAGLPKIPPLGQEIYCREFVMKSGGGANCPISLARLGIPVTLLTQIGNDAMGHFVLGELEKAHVRTVGNLMRDDIRTDVSAVLSTPEDRCFASFCPDGFAISEKTLETEIRDSDIVHTYLGYCFQYPIGELCNKYRKILILDASWADVQEAARGMKLAAQCDLLKLNREESRCLTGAEDPEEAVAVLAGQTRMGCIITMGESGSLGMDSCGNRYYQNAIPAGPFLDSCGAGDNFSAGILFGLARGKPLQECMYYGAQVSGQSVTWYGGNDSALSCTKPMQSFYT